MTSCLPQTSKWKVVESFALWIQYSSIIHPLILDLYPCIYAHRNVENTVLYTAEIVSSTFPIIFSGLFQPAPSPGLCRRLSLHSVSPASHQPEICSIIHAEISPPHRKAPNHVTALLQAVDSELTNICSMKASEICDNPQHIYKPYECKMYFNNQVSLKRK